tara:strand:+ start:639 stop:1145 length:507 start_codon:yes stop_codon:yes gene_type:complete
MNVEPLIASLPSKSDKERRTIRTRAEDWVANGTPEQREVGNKVLKVFVKLEEREARDSVEARVERAFTAIPPSDHEVRLLQVLLDNPGKTNRELSRELGWDDNGFDMHFGMMCRDRQPNLGPAPDAETRDGKFYSGLLADYGQNNSGFTMKSAPVAGLAEINITKART